MVADIWKTLLDAIDLYVEGTWKLIGDEESEGNEAENDDDDDNDNNDNNDENWNLSLTQ